MPVDLPAPEGPTAPQRLRVDFPVDILARNFGDAFLLVLCQEHISVSADGQMLAMLLLESPIDAALAVERVQVVYVILRSGFWPLQRVEAPWHDVCSFSSFEGLPVLKGKLQTIDCNQNWSQGLPNQAGEWERGTYNLESVEFVIDADFPNLGVHVFIIADECNELDVGSGGASKWLEFWARNSGKRESLDPHLGWDGRIVLEAVPFGEAADEGKMSDAGEGMRKMQQKGTVP